jgi:hypothetical protein
LTSTEIIGQLVLIGNALESMIRMMKLFLSCPTIGSILTNHDAATFHWRVGDRLVGASTISSREYFRSGARKSARAEAPIVRDRRSRFRADGGFRSRVFMTCVEPWTLTAYFYPGAKRTVQSL